MKETPVRGHSRGLEVTHTIEQTSDNAATEKAFFALVQAASILNSTVRTALGKEGLSASHLRLLQILMDRQRASPMELAYQLKVTPGAITGLMNRLETEGLVARTRKLDDHRIVEVVATDTARERYEKIRRMAINELSWTFQGWTVYDIQKFQDYLDRLIIESGQINNGL